MLRLRVLTSTIVIVDTMLFAALVPLLPRYVDDLGLSKTSAGIVFAAYAAGALVFAIPGGAAAARFGPRTAAVAGLVLMAASSVLFGFAESALTLALARFAQGVGSALSWAGALTWLVAATPRERRGEMLGIAIGSAVFGALLGPVLGAAASLVQTEVAFTVVGGIALGLALWAVRTPGTPAEPQPVSEIVRVLRRPRFLGALVLMVLPALLFGIVDVLVPLRLDDAGWSALAIGAVFLVAAASEAVVTPVVGRVSDRVGRLKPLRGSLAAAALVSAGFALAREPFVVAVLVLAAALAFGAFWAPASALLSEAAERRGLALGLAFGLMNLAWATGTVIGPAVGGALADVAGDTLPYALAAGVFGATALALTSFASPGTRPLRVPGEP
jgi:MFS family permease